MATLVRTTGYGCALALIASDPKFQANAIEEHDEENEPEEDLNAADAVADDQPQLCETTEFVVSQKSQQSSSGARWMQPTKASSARLNANSS